MKIMYPADYISWSSRDTFLDPIDLCAQSSISSVVGGHYSKVIKTPRKVGINSSGPVASGKPLTLILFRLLLFSKSSIVVVPYFKH